MPPAFIGIDWGTTHRRASLLGERGELLAQRHDDDGALACAGRFGESLQALLAQWSEVGDGVPVVMAGMVGSALGWQEVPYADAATPLRQLGARLSPVRDAPAGRRWAIVPGVCWRGAHGSVDVMRGEETQLLGALQALGTAGDDGCYLLPGTHSKWVQLREGAVASLRTCMSGELFALLRERGTLSAAMKTTAADAEPDPVAFARGVADAAEGVLSHTLFGAPARVVTGAMPAEDAAAYVSGLLIGSEWHEHLRRDANRGGVVRVIGEPALARLHAQCAVQLGCRVELLDARAVQLAAWQALRASMETC
ncbi:2-dehydro-3-deoxygalactonokinase [Ideonella sp.]|uniref:2-dehydro-3-deoxygalactonokinase n=1 Tax=Ideonella sp. TaxID=1929293 RepID=UPI0035B366BF